MGTNVKVKSSTVINSKQNKSFVYKPLPKIKLNCKNCK